MYVCVPVQVCTHMCVQEHKPMGTHGDQKRKSSPLLSLSFCSFEVESLSEPTTHFLYCTENQKVPLMFLALSSSEHQLHIL